MHLRAGGRAWRALVVAGLALYTAFLLSAPFEHHDLSCELKTPQHCIACTASVVSSDPGVPGMPGAEVLADAGTAAPFDVLAQSLLLAVRTTGRSPPAVL